MPDPLVPFRPAGTRTPLYCVHAASGSPYSYLPLIPLLDDDQPVYGFEAPGFEDEDEKPLTSVTELARSYVAAIVEDRPGEPVVVLGWSLGGVIGYEMAGRLRAMGTPVPMLITVDTLAPAPCRPPEALPMLRRFVGDLTGASPFADQRALDEELARRSAADDALEETFAALTAAGLIPAELDPATLRRRYAVFRANILALHAYHPPGGYPGPMVTVRGAESPPDGMDWSGLCADVTAETVPGDHYTMWQGEGLTALAHIVREAVQRTCARRSRDDSTPNTSNQQFPR